MTPFMPSACPECGERKRTTLTVSPTSERFPYPVYKWVCKQCGTSWVQDDNPAPVPLPTRVDIQ